MKSLIAMSAAALCCVALAEGPQPGGMPRGGMMPPGMPGMSDPILRIVSSPKGAEKLGLTAEQQEKLKSVMGDRKNVRESQKKVREATMKQVELMKAEKIDEAAVMAAIDEVFEIRKQMAKDQAKRLIAVKSILTPEQIAKAREDLKATFGARGQRPGGHRGGRNGAPAGADEPAPPPEN